MFILCRKLKLLKRPLEDLNKLHFSHIFERVSRAEAELENFRQLFRLIGIILSPLATG
jgi:hypothetical protein